MRVWSPDTDKYSDTAPLRATLPTRPCAVYLYTKRRTQLLALDFDTSSGGQTAVEADLAQAISWITHCGGVCVTDRSTSGGRHLLVPLAIGTSASVDEIAHLMRLLATRLPTLDIAPNLGRNRRLPHPARLAVQARRIPPTRRPATGRPRSIHHPILTPAAAAPLRPARRPVPQPTHQPLTTSPPHHALHRRRRRQLRLAAPYVRHDPLPPAVHDFATHATLNATDRTWPTPSEARMSVIAHAVWRGHTLATHHRPHRPRTPLAPRPRRRLPPLPPPHPRRPDQGLPQSPDLAQQPTSEKTDPRSTSRKAHRGGSRQDYESRQLRRWLANGYAWADSEFRGQRYRWTVHAVLQTLAVSAARAGEIINGTPVVAVGGRSLSLGSGLLSPDTIWRTLRDLRDRPGSPVTLIRPHRRTQRRPIRADQPKPGRRRPSSQSASTGSRCPPGMVSLGPAPAPRLRTRRRPPTDQQKRHLRGGPNI